MVDYVKLDENIAGAFTPLYQGDINEYLDSDHFAYGAVNEDGEPVGLFLATFLGEDASIDWLYVREDSRNKELGTRMLKGGVTVLDDLFGIDVVSVCCSDEAMKDFLEKRGCVFSNEVDRYSYRGTLSDFIGFPMIRIPEKTVFSLSELTPSEFKGLNIFFRTLDKTPIPFNLPISKEDYLDVPAVYLKDDRIRAFLLFKEISKEEVSIAYAYAYGHDGRALLSIIQEAEKDIRKAYGDDVIISTASLGENTEKMVEALFPGVEKTPIYTGLFVG